MDRRVKVLAAAIAALALAGGTASATRKPILGAPADWRKVVTRRDHDRLMNWRSAWSAALAATRDAGEGGRIDGDPALFDPDRALDTARPPEGAYHCRWFRLGQVGAATRSFTVNATQDCRIGKSGETETFVIRSGPQRPAGLLFRDNGRRAVFLGTMVLGDETAAIDYGRDLRRDLAGYIERIGERRWRLVLPRSSFGSTIDVIEVTADT